MGFIKRIDSNIAYKVATIKAIVHNGALECDLISRIVQNFVVRLKKKNDESSEKKIKSYHYGICGTDI